ncbi:MAG: HD domain-containing protein [Desulfobacterales bacterium]|nr:MAG: HD domain-containing protein [Desulfobacterales bacterium]
MTAIYARIRERARQIAARSSVPDFYRDHAEAIEISRQFFETDPILRRLELFLSAHLEDDFGHGRQHAIKVAEEAGALMSIEGRHAGYRRRFAERRVCIVQCAGLLHDVKRKQKNHAAEGATYAREVLQDYPLSPEEVDDVAQAICNHEAFKREIRIRTHEGLLVSDCLYDADKFRWGPDNFKDTLWDMVSFFEPPLVKFMEHYPEGMEKIAKIRSTFRTPTGQIYGPQFIDLGLAIGQELFEVINTEFSEFL